ncbi:LysR family transcriptional regulator [Leucobacter luti]|uniref:LysR family transcriptional regulator n=1 Tax=Leucobacter luti TaxID=340320 RepID=UPI0010F01D45|nr:LysR substrate-binding domain-containing protein [Leucobacter luti]MCW2288306.1 DNA-binding transcriptional LysR family regulator [Leucobacter luti]QYM75746.1 LysR family transcriptional regulator [Leucobacter luti]TCK45537.1 DNA-binding transcriptional LysR family regulator [Leucobacter luti]
MMTLQQFRVLLAIREHGSLTQAAEALQYGVPTVTHHLRTLEAHLRVRLVDRDRRGAHLTPLGAAFAEDIAPVLVRIDRAERAVADQRDAGVVTLRIGTFSSIGSRLIPAAIAQLQQRTSVRVEVVEAEPTEVMRQLQAGEVHAGLVYDVSDELALAAPGIERTTLLSEPYRVMVAKSGPLAEAAVLDFAALAEVAWVCSRNPDEASDRVLRRVCHSLGYPVREVMRTDDLTMIHGLVAEGLGCALTTAAAVDADFDVVLRPAVQDLGERRVSFVTRRGQVPPAVRWLEEILRRLAVERAAK